MSIRKLSQVLLSSALVFASLFSTAATAQDVSSSAAPFVPSRVTQRVDETSRVVLRGNTNPLARKQFDRGLVEPSLPMEQMVLLLKRSPEQEAALAAFNQRQQDPNSPDFHHWLHAEEFGRMYGPSDADMATVTAWLERHGFRIDTVSKGRVSIQFSGTAAQVQEAFSIEMHNYLVSGKAHIANDRDPQIPEALAPVVEGIASLHNFFGHHLGSAGNYVHRDLKTGAITKIEPQPVAAEKTPAADPLTGSLLTPNKESLLPELHTRPEFSSTNPNSGKTHEDLAPGDFATVYNITPLFNQGINGKGVTVAITATSDVLLSDIATYRKSFGLTPTTVNVIETNNATDPGVSDPGENTEDLEMVSAAAPGATLDLVVSNSTTTTSGFELSNEYIIDNEVAPIMTVSYGSCELFMGTALNATVNKVFQQGATEGITIFVASGDSGSATCERQETTPPAADVYGDEVSGYASTPYATAVGGTDFNWSYNTGVDINTYWNATNSSIFATAKGYIPEIPWNTTCASPSLLTVFASNGVPSFSSSEQLCNTAIGDPNFGGLVTFSGGGGGYSRCTTNSTPANPTTMPDSSSCSGGYAKPSWQAGPGVPNDGKRDVPDIAMFASYGYSHETSGADINSTAILVCQSNAAQGISCDYTDPTQVTYQENGGTSAASPFSAGVMALILQKTGTAQGLANPEFYKLAAGQNTAACNSSTVAAGNACIFYDITTGSNAQVCVTGDRDCVTTTAGDQVGIMNGFNGGVGYDQATGLGTLNVTNLVNAWPSTAPTITLAFSPTSVTFASTTVGVTTAAQVVTVKNTGSAAATLTSIALTGSTDFATTATTCGTSLAAGATCTVSVDFKPAAAGAATGAISFTDSATGSPQSVALSGTGVAAALTVTVAPTTLTFASTTVGATTAAQVVTVKNTSISAVTLGTIGFTGTGATSYVKSATTCTTSLAAAASCTISVEFKPTTAGALPASLSIADNATGTPQLVAITGTGVAAALTVTVSPTVLTFASTTVGATTAAQIVTVKNTSISAVTLGTIGFTGTGATSYVKSATTCTTSLAAAASCTISVEFKPAAVGSLPASLSIADNATGTPQLVSLTGTGIAAAVPTLTLSVTSLAFPATAVGSTSDLQIVTLTNPGTLTATLTSITIAGTNPTSFLHLTTCGATLAAKATCSVYVSFKPTAAAALTGTLTITDNASGSPQKVTLTGTGTAVPALKLSATALAFGTVKVGTQSAIQIVTLTNSGTAVVSLDAITLGGTNAASFLALDTCGATLTAGQACSVYVGFTPTATGALTGSLSIVSNGSGSPQTVALTGTGN
jgi:hypothetical protein